MSKDVALPWDRGVEQFRIGIGRYLLQEAHRNAKWGDAECRNAYTEWRRSNETAIKSLLRNLDAILKEAQRRSVSVGQVLADYMVDRSRNLRTVLDLDEFRCIAVTLYLARDASDDMLRRYIQFLLKNL